MELRTLNPIVTRAVTMTSREIAELTGKRHDNVMRVCRDLAADRVCPQIEETSEPHPQNGQAYTVCRLNRRDSLVLVARLSPEFTGAVVDRWMELEADVIAFPPVPKTFSDALRLAADQAETIAQQAAQLAAAAPAIEFVQKYADSTGLLGFREVCKVLKVKENVFRDFLLDRKIAYRLGSALTPAAQHIDAGRFQVKAGTSMTNGHAFNSMRFTPKGVQWVAGEYAKHQLQVSASLPTAPTPRRAASQPHH
jgi:phage antirepressor YoqD-like protein